MPPILRSPLLLQTFRINLYFFCVAGALCSPFVKPLIMVFYYFFLLGCKLISWREITMTSISLMSKACHRADIQKTFISGFRWGNWGAERRRDAPKLTQPSSERTRSYSQAFWLPLVFSVHRDPCYLFLGRKRRKWLSSWFLTQRVQHSTFCEFSILILFCGKKF